MPTAEERITGSTYPTVTIAGKEYTLKSIPAIKAFDLADVIEMGFATMMRASEHKGSVEPAQVLQIITAVLRKNRTMFVDIFAHVLGVKAEEFNNGERFPLSTFPKLLNVLGDHPDIQDFLSEVQSALKDLPEQTEESADDETPLPEGSEPSVSTEDIQDGGTTNS